MKANIIRAFLLLLLLYPVYSQEISQDVEVTTESSLYKAVDGLENWSYDYDISDLEDGKYNLIIRSRDKAGNMSIDGPINIYVDSASDLPQVSISSPSREMRIGGDFNIVGSATDDDGVASVHVRIDEGSWIKAEGTSFWSSFISASGIEDGKHTIWAKATDINGVEGHEVSVAVNVDKIKPLITIDSHSNGEILSGKKKIGGFVTDANGIEILEYSLDGETWEELKLSGKDDHIERKFELTVDTRDQEGGTSYIRLRAKDWTGSESAIVFVYYSDNEKPQITILSPLEEDRRNGRVTIFGTVTDEVGISTFSSIKDGIEEVFDLIPGNPYWSRTFDFTGEKGGEVIFKAVDLSGNTEEYKFKIKLNPEEDLPVISLISFEDGGYLEPGDPVLRGYAVDDDGVESVSFSIDGGELQNQPTQGSFHIDTSELIPGKHTIEISGTDMYGTAGEWFKTTFLLAAEKPVLIPLEYVRDKEILSWFDGAVFQQGKTAKINGRIDGGEGDVSIIYSFNGLEEGQIKSSKGFFSLPVPGKAEPGAYDFTLTARDSLERESSYQGRIYIAPAPATKEEVFTPVQQDSRGLVLIDNRIDQSLPVNLTEDLPLTGYLVEEGIESVELIPPVPGLIAERKDQGFSISAREEVAPASFAIKVIGASGQEYTSREIVAGSDLTPPGTQMENLQVPVLVEKKNIIEKLEKDENGEDVLVEKVTIVREIEEVESTMIQDSLILKGMVSDISGIEKAEVSFIGSADSYSAPQSVGNLNEEGDFIIDEEFDLSSVQEGNHFLLLTVTDGMGNSVKQSYPITIDRTSPTFKIISPSSTDAVEGIITVAGYIDGFSGGGELYFSANGINAEPVEMMTHESFFHHIDLSAENMEPEFFQFRAIDQGRNVTEFTPDLNVDLEADRPVVAVEVPAAGSTIRNDFSVTGLVFDDDSVDSIYYSLDGAEYTRIDGNFYYNIPFSLNQLDDGRHEISVYAEDSGGFPSESVLSDFVISKEEPVSELIRPSIEEYVKSSILLQGSSFDENGIDSVYISYDNGVTYNKALLEILEENVAEETEPAETEEGEEVTEESVDDETEEETVKTVQWTYSLDTRLPGDGTHSLLIKAIDGAGTVGISSTIINIDNTLPEIKLDSPGESGIVAGELILDGKVFDGTSIQSVVCEIQSLDNKEIAPEIRTIESDGILREVFDLTSYEPGMYNLNITVSDFAHNSISETRNFRIIPLEESESISLYFPEEGKDFSGPFAIEGQLLSRDKSKVVFMVDEAIFDTAEVDGNGLFSFKLEEGIFPEGPHSLQVLSGEGDNSVASEIRNIVYKQKGPWVSVDNMNSGQFVSGRPLVTGRAGYNGLSEEEEDKSKRVDRIEVSLDNGRSFEKAKGREEWEFRLETYDLPEGTNQLVIRAFFRDGSEAVSKLVVNIDETAPQVELLTPEENRTFNGSVKIVGTAADENGLENVEVLIREGSKSRYEVPSFIQGLYLDFHALGSTYGEVGIGLTFFDDVVKLQAQAGIAPPGRFTGMVFGAKLLATIVDIPFSYFFGYDWDFFSMSLSVGANFNYFTMSPDGYYFTPDGVVLGSVLMQYEFAKFEIDTLKMFNSYSLYVEGGLWFISSDIEAGITPTVSFGGRIGIF